MMFVPTDSGGISANSHTMSSLAPFALETAMQAWPHEREAAGAAAPRSEKIEDTAAGDPPSEELIGHRKAAERQQRQQNVGGGQQDLKPIEIYIKYNQRFSLAERTQIREQIQVVLN
jgi:hypothetical protein